MKIYNGTPSAYMAQIIASIQGNVQWTEDSGEKNDCDAFVYVATPDLDGVSHIIDAVNDSNHWKEKTIFYSPMEEKPIDFEESFNPHQIKSLVATGKMVRVNGGHWFESEDELKQYLNSLATSNG